MTLHDPSPTQMLYEMVPFLLIYCLLVICYTIAPPPPSIISITSSTTALTARWDNGGYNYRVHVQKKGSTVINTFGPVTPPYNITGLESNTEYTVVVEAYNLRSSTNDSKPATTIPEGGNLMKISLCDNCRYNMYKFIIICFFQFLVI